MIVKINLLPWREELRIQEEKRVKNTLAMSCFIGALLAAAVIFFVNEELESRAMRIGIIDTEIARLGSVEQQMNERKALTEKLKQQLEVLQDLSAQRSEVVGLMEKFSSVIPQDAFIISLGFTLNQLSFSAIAGDQDVLASHLKGIQSSIGDAPIPANREVTIDGNRVVSYNVVVDPRRQKQGGK